MNANGDIIKNAQQRDLIEWVRDTKVRDLRNRRPIKANPSVGVLPARQDRLGCPYSKRFDSRFRMHGSFSDGVNPIPIRVHRRHTVLLEFFGWLDHRITKETKNIWQPVNADEGGYDQHGFGRCPTETPRPRHFCVSAPRLNTMDPRLPFYEIRTLAEEVDRTLWAERLLAWLSGGFAAIAAVLAAMGVYATLAYAIAQNKREIGIRVALGAQAGDVFRLLSSRPLRFTALGVICGLAGFYAAAPAFRSVLYDPAPADPVTMGAAAAGVLAIAMAATLVAIWGAVRVDPAMVLRDE
jgi:FtsX-like permease family